MGLTSLLALFLLALATHADANHLQLSGRHGATSDLQRRASMSGTMSQLGDAQNMVYLTNVTFNEQPYSIMIDTGRYAPLHHGHFQLFTSSTSSDLWVSAKVPNAVDEKYQSEVSYASGSAQGDCSPWCIVQQHFIESNKF